MNPDHPRVVVHSARHRALALLLCVAQVTPLLPRAALAQQIADPSAPGSQQATVLRAANGVPLIHITTPSAAGVSRNQWRQFDVGGDGVVLNNSRGDVATQLGGWVAGNPWLAGGSARVILNEVNSTQASQLRGFVEVGGPRAEVVIANPAGIVVDGGGFINASRATLTTGQPLMSGGALQGFAVQQGLVRVQGAGLDASSAEHAQILARAVEVNAGLWAQRLDVVTGANTVSADGAAVAPSTPPTGDAPAFALDVSAIGGMYAGKIRLVGITLNASANQGRASTVADAGDVRTERSRDPELDRANR